MSEAQFYASGPAEAGLDPAKVEAMLERAQREVREGLLPSCQVAIARNGKIGAAAAFGEAVQGGAKSPLPTIRSTWHSLAPRAFSPPQRGC